MAWPFCADVMNKYKIGPDGRTAYDNITGHKCKQVAIGFVEVVDYILEPSKGHMHKADTRLMKGVFLTDSPDVGVLHESGAGKVIAV